MMCSAVLIYIVYYANLLTPDIGKCTATKRYSTAHNEFRSVFRYTLSLDAFRIHGLKQDRESWRENTSYPQVWVEVKVDM